MTRCTWAEGGALMSAYRDAEWACLCATGRLLWEMLQLEGAQARRAWRTSLYCRDGYRAAFFGFDPQAVERFSQDDVTRLMGDPGIIRARAKIEAVIGSAKAYLSMQDSGEDFVACALSLVGVETIRNDGLAVLSSTPLSADISKAPKERSCKFVGPVIIHAWMRAVGMVNDHAPNCSRCDVHE